MIFSIVEFPNFNIHSRPLLLLIVQGLIFVALLFGRYAAKSNLSDMFLGAILLIVCYEQICYTVGFMGWYNKIKIV